ncbi:MAG: glycosyltransferase family 2 protein [Phycisphaerae bacterium]|nr:glycosyltransferase family 2 protein [Phycisphaerae bacterium]
MDMESVSIVIPTHDRPACLRRLIEALRAQTTRPAEVIVVSDGAEKVEAGLLERLQAAGVAVRLIELPCASSSASRNAGLAAAGGEIVFCLDDDMIPAPDLLAKLLGLYAQDQDRRVAGIGVPYAEANRTEQWRWWEWAFRLLGRVRWRPRRVAARYVRLPSELARELTPADMISGGAMSLRREVARGARFDETFRGYAFGEDRELSYRLGRDHALFLTRALRVTHAPAEGGRGDWRSRGRAYADNVLHIVRTGTEGGAGTWLLVVIDLAGAFVQHLAWALLTRKRHNLDFALGLAGALLRHNLLLIKEMLCGR